MVRKAWTRTNRTKISIRRLRYSLLPVFLIAAALPAAAGKHIALPKSKLTPGVADKQVNAKIICSGKAKLEERRVPLDVRHQVFAAYGLSGDNDPYCKPKGCELDRLIGTDLGGTDDLRNLWPQPSAGPWNVRMKSRIGNRLRREVCRGRLSLEAAQWAIAQDWTAVYRRYFGNPR